MLVFQYDNWHNMIHINYLQCMSFKSKLVMGLPGKQINDPGTLTQSLLPHGLVTLEHSSISEI